jgi:hypothetical protein
MRLLDLPQARHFCAPSASNIAGISSQSLTSFHASLPKGGVVLLREGTTQFHVHQVSLLDSIDRWLVYSLTLYRRSVDMLVPASAPWAQVTLYYSSFFAANAILGIFGSWIGSTQLGERVVDVERGVAGDQQLQVHRNLLSPNGAKGSHRKFWDFFYDGSATIAAWAPADLAHALSPVNGDFGWQIAERNRVNYDMFFAWSASTLLFDTFNRSRLRTLSGPLQLQLEASETIIKLALYFANAVSLSTSSLEGCGATGTRQQIQKRLASQAPPNLVMQSEFYGMLG